MSRANQDQLKEKELFESMPIMKAIMKLVVPTVIGQIILVVYNMADTYFIGQTNDHYKVAAVTICMPAFMFLSAISNLFGVGGSSVISRSLGQGKTARARSTSAFAMWGCLITTLVYALGAFLLRDTFLNLLGGSDPTVHAYAIRYLMVTVVGCGIGASMSTLFSHLLRSEGRSLQASFGIAMGGILNILLDPLFMFVILPKGNEVLGAAIATGLSNVIAAIYFIVILYRSKQDSVLGFRFSHKMVEEDIPKDVFSAGLPACLMTLCENISYAVLDNLMSANGVIMTTGIGVAKKVNMLAHCMVRGMSQGVLPLIGYNYASGNHKRMRQSVLICMSISVGLATACMVIGLTLSNALITIFLPDGGEAVSYGARFLRILCIGGPFSACAYAFISFFQATGEGLKSLLLALLRKGVLDIPMMFVLNGLYPIYGIVWATPIADMVCCVVAICLFVNFMKHHVNLNRDTVPEID
ncbi:MAG: hypothetical protein IJ240_03625 [Clostridia bacterium]|nr:hypothetical protein [Clostridia bacterium]